MAAKFIYNKSRVRAEFSYLRELLRIADDMMKDGITDYSLEGDAYQLALEIGACATTFEAYVLERLERGED